MYLHSSKSTVVPHSIYRFLTLKYFQMIELLFKQWVNIFSVGTNDSNQQTKSLWVRLLIVSHPSAMITFLFRFLFFTFMKKLSWEKNLRIEKLQEKKRKSWYLLKFCSFFHFIFVSIVILETLAEKLRRLFVNFPSTCLFTHLLSPTFLTNNFSQYLIIEFFFEWFIVKLNCPCFF